MPDLAVAVVSVAASIVAVALMFMGIGLGMRRAFGLRELQLDDCFMAVWTGYGISTCFLIAWNFVFPVGADALAVVLLAGASGLLLTRDEVSACAATIPATLGVWSLALLAVAFAWVVLQCLGEFRSWDGVLYHVQTVKWAKHFAVMPGIANLFGPLAFNQSSFLFNAMVDSGPWEGRGYHLANGVFAGTAIAQAIVHGVGWVHGRALAHGHLFGFAALPVVLHFRDHIASYSTDVPLALLLMVAAARAYALLDDSGANRSSAERIHAFFAIGLLLVVAVSIKLTAAVFMAVTIGVLLGVSWRGRRLPSARATTAILVILAAVVALWIARGVVMSGYPLFPLSAAGMPVEWRAPVEHADAEVAYAVHTERGFTWRFIGSNWVRLMLLNDVYAALVPSLLAGTVILLAWRSRRRQRISSTLIPAWWLLFPILASIAAWFASAPSHRYSPALFWSLAALSLGEYHRMCCPTRPRTLAATVVTLVLVSPVVVEPAIAAVWSGQSVVRAIARHNLFKTASTGALPRMNGSVPVQTFTTDSGLELNVPVKDTARRGLPNACWDAPLPCTPNPAPNLRLRMPGNLRKGFRVDGEWQMLDWPYYWHGYYLPEWRRRR